MSNSEFPILILELNNIELVNYYNERLNAGEPFDIMRNEMTAAGFDEERLSIIVRETDNLGHKQRKEVLKKSFLPALFVSKSTQWLIVAGMLGLIAAIWYHGSMPLLLIFGALTLYLFKGLRRH